MPTPHPQRPLEDVQRPEAGPTSMDGKLRVGIRQVDLTPRLRLGRTAYGPDQRPAYGAYGRLMATVIVIDDGKGERVALVSTELHAGFRWVAEQLGSRCARLGLTVDRIFFSACHIHTGPGPFYGHATYDRIAGTAYLDDWRDHFDIRTARDLTERLATAIEGAVEDLRPGKVGYGTAARFGCSWNRSMDALLMLPKGEDPPDPDLAHPTRPEERTPAELQALAERINAGVIVPPLEETQAGQELDLETVDALERDDLLEQLEEDEELRADTAYLIELLEAIEHSSDEEAEETLEDVMYRLVERRRRGGDIAAAPVLIQKARELRLHRWTQTPHRGLKEELGDRAIVDARVHCFWAENDGGSEGAICFFGATPTLMGDRHPLYSADAFGVASRMAERALHRADDGAFPSVCIGLAGGALGDVNLVSPRRLARVHPKRAKKLLGALELTHEAGEYLAGGIVEAVENARAQAFDSLELTVAFSESRPGTWDQHPVAERGEVGVSALAASEMAGGAAAIRAIGFKEGRSRLLVDDYDADEPQYPKVSVPRMEAPPDMLAFRVVRLTGKVGQKDRVVVLAGMPAEISTMLATCTVESIQAAVRDDTDADLEVPVVVASLVGDYAAYFGTPWEYLAQHYEGASQLWGRWVGAWAREVVTDLATAPSTRATGTASFTGGWTPLPRTDDPTGEWPEPPLPRLGRLARRSNDDLEARQVGVASWEVNAAWHDGPDPGRPLWAGPRIALEIHEAGSWQPVIHQGTPVTDRSHPMLVWKDELGGPWLFRLQLDAIDLGGARLAFRITPDLRRPSLQLRLSADGIETVAVPAVGVLEATSEEAVLEGLFATPAWRHTDHAVGFVAPTGEDVREITSASILEPDATLLNAQVDIRLDRLRVVDYPGGGEHEILVTFQALHAAESGVEQHLAFAQRFRVREGQGAGIHGYPVFRGLKVGSRGLHLGFSTVNIKNAGDEALLEVLDSSEFSNGLALVTTAQPALAPLTGLAKGLAKSLLQRNRNVKVQEHVLGLDLDVAASGARLREGTYIAAQVPNASEIEWDQWRWDAARQCVVPASAGGGAFDFNLLVFRVARR